jgi:hypothetical protein
VHDPPPLIKGVHEPPPLKDEREPPILFKVQELAPPVEDEREPPIFKAQGQTPPLCFLVLAIIY